MANIFAALGLQDSDRSFVNTIGQRAVYDATNTILAQYNADLRAAMRVFVGEATSDHKLRYKLPGGGRLQRRGGQAQSGAQKAYGSWDVAFPLEDFGAQLVGDDVALAYMSLQEYNRHLNSILIADQNTVRFELLKALFNNTERTFVDPIWGSLLVEPLANGDSVTYPPVLGSESDATEDHYLETNYASSAISDTNNPFNTAANELEEHFGAMQGGANIVSFINNAQVTKTRALADFVDLSDMGIVPGSNTATLQGLPSGIPGRIIGRLTDSGVWVSEWRWIPADYIVTTHLDAPPPLAERVDPVETGLGTGLQLVSTDADYPFQAARYRHRFGFGAANRLNGVVTECGTGGTYTIPTAYS